MSMLDEVKAEKEKLQIEIANMIYKFEKSTGVTVTSIKGVVDKDFGSGVSSVVLTVTL